MQIADNIIKRALQTNAVARLITILKTGNLIMRIFRSACFSQASIN